MNNGLNWQFKRDFIVHTGGINLNNLRFVAKVFLFFSIIHFSLSQIVNENNYLCQR